MSGNPDGKDLNGGGEEGPRSIRDVAEATWTEIETTPDAGAEPPQDPGTGQEQPPRDNLGRFAKREEGEQSVPDPAPKTPQIPPVATPEPPAPPAGSSKEPPQNWSAEDRATFAKLPPEGQAFLLKRHSEMERDYHQKTQNSASAVGFVQNLMPIFEDPVIKQSLAEVGSYPLHAISEWAGFHKRAMDPNPNVRMSLLQDLAQRMKLDPAAVFSKPQPPGIEGIPEQDLKHPTIRYLADQLGTALNSVQALRGELDNMRATEQTERETYAFQTAKQGIEHFADEKDAQGNLLRPDFDQVLPQLVELFKIDPDRDLNEAYLLARRMNPDTWNNLVNAERNKIQQQGSVQRAQAAARGNLRGRTSPVSPPPQGDGGPRGLRATIESSAEEIGFEG